MKKIFSFVIVAMLFATCFATETTNTTVSALSNWQLFTTVGLAVYEVFARFVFKGRKYSILETIVNVVSKINTVIPNKEK